MRVMRFLEDLWDQYMARIGRRGLVLLILAIEFGVYGVAMIAAQPSAGWWPVLQGFVMGVPVKTWGAIWVAFAIFLLLGIPLDQDRAQFAAAAGLTSLWAMAAVSYRAALWGPIAIYAGHTLIILVNSSWPDVRAKIKIEGEGS